MQFDRLKRREFITLLGGAAGALPFAANAQQPTRVIGFLSSRSPGESADLVAAFGRGLSEAGFVEGQNLVIAFRWAEGRYDRLPALAADLVGLRVSVIVAAGGGVSPLAAKAATTTIPIVFTTGDDPVRLGLVASLNRPGGNITGVSLLSVELILKRLELLHELMPNAAVIAMLVNPNFPGAAVEAADMQTAARTLGLQVVVLNASTDRDLDTVFASLTQLRAGGVVIEGEPFFNSRREQIIALAARYAIPAIYPFRESSASGGLISYGASLSDVYRQAGIYAGQILQGAKPADLPVMQPTNFELVINLKTAKALGLDVPATLLARADEVIE
jgi:putative tryptophan/tyrosine transport system substrate-binding protein